MQVLACTPIFVHLQILTHTHTHTSCKSSESVRLFTPTISENVSNTRLIVHLQIRECANAAKSPLSLPGQLLPVINKDFSQKVMGTRVFTRSQRIL